MNLPYSFLLMLMLAGTAVGQVRIIGEQTLPLAPSVVWISPKFSPEGKSIYFTSSGYNGIWQYSLHDGTVRHITGDARAGYGFALSTDGRSIAYRRTIEEGGPRLRTQQIVVQDIESGRSSVVATGDNLSTPGFTEAGVIYSIGSATQNLPPSKSSKVPVLLGIEDTKIAIVVDGRKRLLDPLVRGSYIWPALSPDRENIVATDMSRGAFVCNLRGEVLVKLGQRNGAVWTRDGRWLVYMRDRDDGHQIVSSDLYAVRADGATTVRLTFTHDRHEMNPDCSPIENLIVCDTANGEIILLQYEEVPR